ncbi:hypothetical protein LIER_02651 [Lithospermum erythrorhizon]|uniref:Retrotransposon Copia-like N-terminal domain-containing protein n=1 Tax=Lithospermum erythrorhizon TaxID=34254 RepID=A0AAV3NQ98_LITER
MEEFEKIDTSSPYYLGSGDQPGNLLTHVFLHHDNYSGWSRAMTTALKARRKFVFVDGQPQLAPEQITALSSLLESSHHDTMIGNLPGSVSGTSPPRAWIIDTGASHHVTGNYSSLSHLTTVAQCSIGLPNGHLAMATMEGRVLLPGGLVLHRVLYVPNFYCNFLSVPQLTADSNCHLRFTDSLCAI